MEKSIKKIFEEIENRKKLCSEKKKLIEYFTEQKVFFDWHSMGPKKIRLVTHLNYIENNHKNLLEIVDNCMV